MKSRNCNGRKNYPLTYQVRDRHGGPAFNYFRRAGQKDIALPRGSQARPEFYAAYRAVLAGGPVPTVRTALDRKCRAGTWNAMIAAYMATDDFRRLEKKDDRQRAFKVVRDDMRLGDILVAKTDFVLVRQYVDKVAQTKPGWARGLRTTLSLLCQQAILHRLLTANPIREIPRPKLANPDGIPEWSDDEVAQYLAYHQPETMAHRAVVAAVETGLRVSDLCRVGDGDVDRDGLISLIAYKNRRYGEKARVNIPVSDALTAALAATPTVVPIGTRQWLWTVTGKVFSDSYLGECISDWAREAGLPDRSVHGLRKTFVRRMIDAGHHPNDVAAMTGHQDLKLVMFYADKRDKRLSALRVKAASKGAA